MKNTLSIRRGARLCALGCVLLLALATAAYASSFSGTKPRFDESRLGRYVLFPGIGEPVRVAPLEGVAGMYSGYPEMKLPDEVVDKLIRARDRNAFWLLCEARRDYSSIAYTYVFANNAGLATRIHQVEGPYDRGVYFKVPSEYVLYHTDLSKWEYRSEDGYFKIVAAPAPLPERPLSDRSGIPSWLKWAEPLHVCRARAYTDERLLLLLWLRTDAEFVNGCELWFDADDLKLVKEVITEPKALADGSGRDYSQATPIREVQYNYEDYRVGERDYPVQVTVYDKGFKALSMEFKLVEGFWMLRRGKVYVGDPDSEDSYAHGFNTASIVVKH